MTQLSIPKDRQHELLLRCGYYPHPTISNNGMTQYGYVRDVGDKRRWHVIGYGKKLVLHYDITVHGFHKVVSRKNYDKQERMRICRIYREIWPVQESPEKPGEIRMKVGRKGICAPNVRELQKRKTIVRSVWNPMRYLRGKLKVVSCG